jgi:hypothetical protein
MTKASHPVSLRLAMRDIEQLKARARRVSGTLTGIARELIVTGLPAVTIRRWRGAREPGA